MRGMWKGKGKRRGGREIYRGRQMRVAKGQRIG